jgi:transposase-like protein
VLFIGTHRSRKPKKKGKTGRTATPYPFEFRLKVVKLHLEDGCPAAMAAQQVGISNYTVSAGSKIAGSRENEGLGTRFANLPAEGSSRP